MEECLQSQGNFRPPDAGRRGADAIVHRFADGGCCGPDAIDQLDAARGKQLG